MTTCGHCGNPQRGRAAVNRTPLCHPDAGPDCYRLVTVYHHPMPCPDCPGQRELESLSAFVDRVDAMFNALGPPPGWTLPARPTAVHRIDGYRLHSGDDTWEASPADHADEIILTRLTQDGATEQRTIRIHMEER